MSSWGGKRAGSGRKPKSDLERQVTGAPGYRGGTVLTHPSVGQVPVTEPIEEFDAPNDLTMEERQVWMELAPHAFKARTLVPANSFAFKLLCKNVVLERELANHVESRGSGNHRGMIKIVDGELLSFNLAGVGKPVYQAPEEKKPENPLEKFLTRRRG